MPLLTDQLVLLRLGAELRLDGPLALDRKLDVPARLVGAVDKLNAERDPAFRDAAALARDLPRPRPGRRWPDRRAML